MKPSESPKKSNLHNSYLIIMILVGLFLAHWLFFRSVIFHWVNALRASFLDRCGWRGNTKVFRIL